MSIATAITAAQGRVANAYTAISAKGGTLPQTQNLANMPAAINSIPSGGGGSTKYGANIETFLGDVDANGVLQLPNEESELVFTGVKDVVTRALFYRFAYSKTKSALFPDLESVSGDSSFQYSFAFCYSLENASFPVLRSITASQAFVYAFANDSSLANVSFQNLSSITASAVMSSAFYGCVSLSSLSFPALTSNSFGSYTNQFANMLRGVTGCTVHFPSNLQSVIGSWADVTNGFGGTNTTVLFDLPATE